MFLYKDLWFYLALAVICILGLAYSELFFAFTLCFIIYKTDKIMEVINAVWIPRARIISTLVMIVIVMYFFSIIAFSWLHDDFDMNLEDSCSGVFNCFVTMFDSWYKFDGSIGGFLGENFSALTQSEELYHPKALRIIYDSVFNFLIAILLIEILSGIIIDTFSAIRETRESIEQKQKARCYVCNKLNQEIEGFDRHTKFVHNIWDYLYYIGYIRNKQFLENDIEREMKAMIERNDYKYFPCYHTADTETERAIGDVYDKLSSEIKKQQVEFTNNTRDTNEKIDKLANEMTTKFSNLEDSLKKWAESMSKSE